MTLSISPETAKLGLSIPPMLMPLWLGARRRHSNGQVIDAHAQILGEYLVAMRPPGYDPTPDEAREQLRTMIAIADQPGPSLARVENHTIPGPAGEIPVRVYAPRRIDEGPLPVLCYIHGGGFVIGDLDSYDNVCSKLAAWADCLVVSVDYRLAPEHKFPAAPEDCVAAYKWLTENAADLGGDKDRIAIAGDSAGGNLSAVVCQIVAADGGPQPCLQVLIYPATDLRNISRSHKQMSDAFVLPKDRIDWFMGHYLRNDEDRSNPLASPLLATDLSGLAPAYLVTCGFDPLHDEATDYAARLNEAGVEATVREFKNQVHGFTFLTRLIPDGTICLSEIALALKTGFAATGKPS
jgi:acetyl esterase